MSRRFGSTPSDGALSFGNEDETSFRENLDPEQLVRLQINRCNISRSSGDEELFNNNVLSLLAMVPSGKRGEIEDRAEEYTSEVEEYEYVTLGGWKLGSPENPVYRNLPGDLDYDPTLRQVKTRIVKKKEKTVNPEIGEEEETEYDAEEEYETVGEPLLISPKPVKRVKVDYPRLFTILISALEDMKMWFRVEQIQEEGGFIKKKDPPPTPTDADGSPLKVSDEPEEDEDG